MCSTVEWRDGEAENGFDGDGHQGDSVADVLTSKSDVGYSKDDTLLLCWFITSIWCCLEWLTATWMHFLVMYSC